MWTLRCVALLWTILLLTRHVAWAENEERRGEDDLSIVLSKILGKLEAGDREESDAAARTVVSAKKRIVRKCVEIVEQYTSKVDRTRLDIDAFKIPDVAVCTAITVLGEFRAAEALPVLVPNLGFVLRVYREEGGRSRPHLDPPYFYNDHELDYPVIGARFPVAKAVVAIGLPAVPHLLELMKSGNTIFPIEVTAYCFFEILGTGSIELLEKEKENAPEAAKERFNGCGIVIKRFSRSRASLRRAPTKAKTDFLPTSSQ